MHIPDGILNMPVLITTNLISASVLVPAINKVNRQLSVKRIPLMGLSAAFVFTVQMLSFPVPGGTSVHISGALLISVLLGPLSGTLITTSAVLMQALLFQHGGLLAIGANILNIAIAQSLLAYYLYRLMPGSRKQLSIGLAALLGKLLGGALLSFQLYFADAISAEKLNASLAAILGSQLIGGIIEGLVIGSIFMLILRVRPDIIEMEKI